MKRQCLALGFIVIPAFANAQDNGLNILAEATMKRAYACSLWSAAALLKNYPDPLEKIAAVAFDSCPYEWGVFSDVQRLKLRGGEGVSQSATSQILREMSIPQIVKIINESKGSTTELTAGTLMMRATLFQRDYEKLTH